MRCYLLTPCQTCGVMMKTFRNETFVWKWFAFSPRRFRGATSRHPWRRDVAHALPHSEIRSDSVAQDGHSLPCPLSVLIPTVSVRAFFNLKNISQKVRLKHLLSFPPGNGLQNKRNRVCLLILLHLGSEHEGSFEFWMLGPEKNFFVNVNSKNSMNRQAYILNCTKLSEDLMQPI